MSDKPNLEEIRKELDDLNERMLDTISQRMQLVEKVAAAKLAQPGQKLRDKERERVMLAELAKKAREKGLNPYYVKRIFNDLIEYSLDDQSRHMSRRDPAETKDLVRIGFQGVEGAYSHLAAQKHFAKDLENAAFVGYSTFGDAFRACERGDLDFVVLPLENTIGGSINATYRLLEDSALHIVGEEVWQVQHCLIGLENVPLGRVRHIASHPQALLQCSAFLASLPGITVESFTDTAEAVRRLKERQEITHAAIASEDAAERYGLHVLKRDIADQKENYTKFVVCAKNPVEYDARLDTKISLVLATNHKEGALLQCLRPFHEHGLNLLKLESRPKLHTPWEYQFYVDFEGHIADQNVTNALEQIQRHTSYLKVLGCYPIRTQGFDAVQVAEDVESTALKEEVAGAFCETPAEPAKTKSAKPYRLAARESGDEKTEIKVGDVVLGDGSFTVIAGPCAVESREQIMESAKLVRDLGGVMLRGGVFKPRTSPYSF
ncbi:prephenate dehydratase, partial [bacterium]|nr:prephenate dehydratase [bacterium]